MVANHFKNTMMISKSLSYLFSKMANHRLSSVKSTAFPNPPLVSGSSSILPFRSMMAKSLLPNRLRNYKNAMPSSKRRTLSKKSDCHIHASLKQRLDAVHRLRFQHRIITLCRVLKVNRSTYYKHFYSPTLPVFLSIRSFGALSLLFMLIMTNAWALIRSTMSSSVTMASASVSDSVPPDALYVSTKNVDCSPKILFLPFR